MSGVRCIVAEDYLSDYVSSTFNTSVASVNSLAIPSTASTEKRGTATSSNEIE